MTSEIVIMTPNAVALAADSAVTIDYKKTYNGINKLFMLSNNPPIGIMFYNTISFLNIPFETIIKEFRKSIHDSYNQNFYKKIIKRGINEFNSVSEFQGAFIKYIKLMIKKSDFKFSFESQLNHFILNTLSHVVNETDFYEKIINLSLPDNELIKQICESIDELYLNQCTILATNVATSLKPNKNNDKFIKNFIKFIIWELFAKNYTGIVLTGFNNDELFPNCSSFKICYLYDNKYILSDFKQDHISINTSPAIINMFAQHDVINSFLKSIDPTTKSKIIKEFDEINKKQLDNLIESIDNNAKIDDTSKSEIINQIKSLKDENITKEFEKLIENIETNHLTPSLLYISALPYSELSNLCESLIKITSLKRKVGSNLESVGGDVDVAIITKGDGFIWTKRKHYFDSDLNYQFFEKKEQEKL